MQSELATIVLSVAVLLLAASSQGIRSVAANPAAAATALCEPTVIDEMPSHIKKVCLALENSNQLSTALTAYLRNEASAIMYRPDDLAMGPGTGKRTDVDHVFLRFGRRR